MNISLFTPILDEVGAIVNSSSNEKIEFSYLSHRMIITNDGDDSGFFRLLMLARVTDFTTEQLSAIVNDINSSRKLIKVATFTPSGDETGCVIVMSIDQLLVCEMEDSNLRTMFNIMLESMVVNFSSLRNEINELRNPEN